MRRWFVAIVLFFSFAVVLGYVMARFRGDGPVAAVSAVPAEHPSAPSSIASHGPEQPKAAVVRKRIRMVAEEAEPLKDAFSDLTAQAKAGNVEAATRLYSDLSRCRSMPGVESVIFGISQEILRTTVNEMGPSELESYQAQLDSVEINKEHLQRLHHLCDGITDDMVDSRFWAMQKAAELGDSYARACVLQKGPGVDMRRLASQPQLLEQYRASAPALIRSGLAAGDWRVVEILNDAYASDSDSLLGGVLGADPVQRYRFLKLYSLGYHLEYAQYSTEQLGRKLAAAGSALTAEQLSAADTWAEDSFRGEFQGNYVSESTMTWGDACAF